MSVTIWPATQQAYFNNPTPTPGGSRQFPYMNLFALALVVLFFGAGVQALLSGHYNEALYGFLGAALNYVVYFKPFN